MALNADRDTPARKGAVREAPVAANTIIYAGGMTAITTAGVARPPSAASDIVLGRSRERADNATGADGDVSVDIEAGTFRYANSAGGDEITRAHIGDDCFAVDDERVARTNGGSSRPRAGSVFDVDALGVWVKSD